MSAYDDDPLTQHIEERRKALSTTPRTAAGPRERIIAFFSTNEGDTAALNEAFDAIEADARVTAEADFEALGHDNVSYLTGKLDGYAAALDEARAAVAGIMPVAMQGQHAYCITRPAALAAIDALRERLGE